MWMNEKHYQQVLQAIPKWNPSPTARRFSVSVIMDIIDKHDSLPSIGYMDAYEIVKRLQREKKMPKGWD